MPDNAGALFQVYAWLLTASSNPPVITKTYDVDVPRGVPSHKKIAYTNPWDKPRFYRVLSSDESILKPRYDRLEIPPQERAYVRVRAAPSTVVDPGPQTHSKPAGLERRRWTA